MLRLNLGCSDAQHPDYLGVDIWTPPWATPENFKKTDLRKRWPFEDSSVDEIRAHDIFEHLPVKVHTMNEAHRILKPGGMLDLFIPTTEGRGAFQDPTHVSFWTPNDIWYFSDMWAEWQRFHEAYGVTANFKVYGSVNAPTAQAFIDIAHREYGQNVWKLKLKLEAVK